MRTLLCVADDPVCNCLASPQTAVGRAIQVFAWSSYPDYVKAPAKRSDWLRVNRLLIEHRIAKDSAVGRARFEAQMEQGRAAEDRRAYHSIRRGWCFGRTRFGRSCLCRWPNGVREYHYSEERQGERGAEGARDCGGGIEADRVDGGGSEA